MKDIVKHMDSDKAEPWEIIKTNNRNRKLHSPFLI